MAKLRSMWNTRRLFSNMRIATKFLVIAAIVLAGFAVILYTYHAQQNNQKEVRALNDEAERFSRLTDIIENGLQNTKLNEKEFLLTSNPRYIENNYRQIRAIQENIGKLQALTRDKHMQDIITALETTTVNYQTAFLGLVDAMERLGLDHESGLHGKLRKAVHDVEESLEAYNQIVLSHSMLMMRRHEKDYMVRKLDKYLEKMAAEQERFAGLLEESDLPRADKSAITGRIKEYYQTFLLLPSLYAEIEEKAGHMNDTNDMADLQVTGLLGARDGMVEIQKSLIGIATVRLNKTFYIVIGCVVTAVSLLLFLIARTVIRAVNTAMAVAESIAQGNLNNQIKIKSKDETGQLLASLDCLQETLHKTIESERNLAAAGNRTKQALDNSTNNIMLLDLNYRIIYMNKAMQQFLEDAETDFRLAIPDFSADDMMGTCIDKLHNDPDKLRKMMSSPDTARTTAFPVGAREIHLAASPVLDEQSEHTGIMVEWSDRTQKNAIEREIQSIVNSALSGNLTQRIDLTGKSGFYKMLSDSINKLVDVSDRVIDDTVQLMGAMSAGDLTRSIEGDYQGTFSELRDNANATIAKLTEVLGTIRSSADNVLNGSLEIADGNTNLSQRTEEQASSLAETASSMDEMTATVRQNADNAKQASQLAVSACDLAEKGGNAVSNVVTAMSDIKSCSGKIADIITVIDEIAFQTNLLALNAAVEAARAGEQGRGFAVVAGEVRNLAGRSATAAREIKELIKESVASVGEGSRLANDSGQTLDEIITSIRRVSDIIAEIAAAGEQQSAGIEQVNKTIAQMDDMTQQNAALVEQAASASAAMGEQAESLTRLVSFFKTGDEDRETHRIERRSGSRPWKDEQLSPDNRGPAVRKVAGTDTDEWQEF